MNAVKKSYPFRLKFYEAEGKVPDKNGTLVNAKLSLMTETYEGGIPGSRYSTAGDFSQNGKKIGDTFSMNPPNQGLK